MTTPEAVEHPKLYIVKWCGFCGDVINSNDPDNETLASGRIDCGKCVRGMRRTAGD